MVKMSKTSKLGTMSWSLQAIETCPGSRGANGELVDACSGCYATTNLYLTGPVKAVRSVNKMDWQREDWVADMIEALKKQTHFRWFDSGDMYHIDLAEKMYQIMVATPNTKHWLPTRMYKFEKFKGILDAMQALPNVMVRFSSDSVTGEFSAMHGSTIIPEGAPVPAGVLQCHSYTNAGKCGSCRACYDKSIPVIGYVSHGRKMAKVIAIKLAA